MPDYRPFRKIHARLALVATVCCAMPHSHVPRSVVRLLFLALLSSSCTLVLSGRYYWTRELLMLALCTECMRHLNGDGNFAGVCSGKQEPGGGACISEVKVLACCTEHTLPERPLHGLAHRRSTGNRAACSAKPRRASKSP